MTAGDLRKAVCKGHWPLHFVYESRSTFTLNSARPPNTHLLSTLGSTTELCNILVEKIHARFMNRLNTKHFSASADVVWCQCMILFVFFVHRLFMPWKHILE